VENALDRDKDMKTTLSFLTTGILTAAIGTGFGQPIITTQPQSLSEKSE